ncbi:Crp/Fnr family transcriptional regulator [Formosa haliotis]|uniref:Crp/Fnr family transcriptional regulator n=1 Tax=Formosa haliotis TaxID=1555194 RepID=UPI0008259078|nr:Crp/Fnr family transcriptional regulator [Formosa haliotis]
MSAIWFFEDVNLFKVLCPHKFAGFKQNHSFDTYDKKDYIYFEQDTSNKVFVIEKGKVKVGYYTEEGQEVVKAILSKGELFGEKAMLGEEKREEFAQALTDNTAICPIGVDTMHDLMRQNQNFSIKIYKFIGFRFKKLERRLELLLFKDAKTRLLEFLEDLFREYGSKSKTSSDRVIKHPYTQGDIASLIGTSRPTLNILLNELKEDQLIDFNRKEIRLYYKSA